MHLQPCAAARTGTRPQATLAVMNGQSGQRGQSGQHAQSGPLGPHKPKCGPLPRTRSGPHTPTLRVLIAAGIALATCTRVSDDQPFPPVQNRLTIARTIPEQSETIPADAQIDFCFSGYVDPRALDDFAASVSSGCVFYDAELDLQLFAWRPPGAASGTANTAWCAGSVLSVRPRAPLRPGVLFHVRLQPEAVGWAGEKLDVTTPGWIADDGIACGDPGEPGPAFLLEFTIAESEADSDTDGDTGEAPEDPPPAPTLADLFAPGQVFNDRNPACSCHREEDSLARARLDLSSPSAAFADLVLPAEERSTGFPMVSPRRPSESYLVQTLLRDPDGTAIYGVLGEPMPPDEPLAHADMTAIARWIEGGALP